jgi:hypothetical protein
VFPQYVFRPSQHPRLRAFDVEFDEIDTFETVFMDPSVERDRVDRLDTDVQLHTRHVGRVDDFAKQGFAFRDIGRGRDVHPGSSAMTARFNRPVSLQSAPFTSFTRAFGAGRSAMLRER